MSVDDDNDDEAGIVFDKSAKLSICWSWPIIRKKKKWTQFMDSWVLANDKLICQMTLWHGLVLHFVSPVLWLLLIPAIWPLRGVVSVRLQILLVGTWLCGLWSVTVHRHWPQSQEGD